MRRTGHERRAGSREGVWAVPREVVGFREGLNCSPDRIGNSDGAG